MFGIYFLERVCDITSNGALVCLALLVFPNRLSDAGADMSRVESARGGAWALLGLMIGLIAVLVVFRLHGAAILDRVMARWRDAGGLRSRVAAAITGISEGLQAIRTTSDLWMAVFYSAAHWLLATLIYLGVAKAFGDAFLHSDMNIAGAMLLIGITLVGSVLQLPGVGGGTQIAAFIGLTKIFGVEQEPAMAIAVSLWIVTFAGCTLAGIPLLIHEGMSFGELRQLARAEADAEESGKHIPVPGANGTTPPPSAVKDAVKEKLRGDSAR
jgi:hypothetical protein